MAALLAATGTVPSLAYPSGAPRPVAAQDLHELPFEQLHAPVAADGGALVFGALKAASPPDGARARLLGRWEGYDLALPVPRDWKIVLFVEEIHGDAATVALWAGTNLQRPRWAARFPAEVRGGEALVLTWRATLEGVERTFTFRLDPTSDRLLGSLGPALLGVESWERVVLTRDRRFLVHRDYPAYLAGKRIQGHPWEDPALARFGAGYLVYLPPGYETSADRRWPLILFFCGTGDRGTPLEDLAKASPFLFIRERGDLPAVILAPALNDSPRYRSFPTDYMKAVLDEALSRYRVDPARVAVTGLSMGGEAAIRLTLTSPERIAAAAVVSMADPRFDRGLQAQGFEAMDLSYRRAAAIPFYVVNGGRDPWISPRAVKRTVEAMQAAGVEVEWKLLPENGHDTWTDTSSDPAFYEWLLAKRR